MGPDVLKCRDITELATDYTEGALPLRRRLAFGLHLAMCSMCRAYMDQLAKARRLLAGRGLDTPREAESQVIERVERGSGPPG